ncbi:hypothetical protein VE00_08980 [Pseudogymnoascus sp. WSF 3629]|nr:hypothetical protein VE00_08980 [Pseudogymnoascus sp. WSF 3629]
MSEQSDDAVPPSSVPLAPSADSTADPSATAAPIATPANEADEQPPLDGFEDARRIVRLLQCAQCSLPLREPMTLPCGNSLCKQCLPEIHTRQNITYPATAARMQGIDCPFPDCMRSHALGDCSMDVTLSKVVAQAKISMDEFRPVIGEAPILLEEKDEWAAAGIASLSGRSPRSRALPGGRLIATYKMVELGELAHDAEVAYKPLSGATGDSKDLDATTLEAVKDKIRSEFDCQICYAIYLDPLTTTCGHTFCRKCLQRVLDHSSYCPICRRLLDLSHTISPAQYPSNARLVSLLAGLWPSLLATRRALLATEESPSSPDLDLPLFVCTISFPTMPTFLHVFEPRYRLMMRRVLDSDRRFGMLLHNPEQIPQPGLASTPPFFEYGTLLHIVSAQLLPDGRSLIETVGISLFRVLRHGVRDGYIVGDVERVEDLPLADEEALEIADTTIAVDADADADADVDADAAVGANPFAPLSTQDLMALCTAFVRRMRAASAPWMHARTLRVYGECPTSPAQFPWWFASVLPLPERDKYALLQTTSVRERLKICAAWVERIERMPE